MTRPVASEEQMVGRWVAVLDGDALPQDGEMKATELGDEHILLCRIDGRLYATSNVCTHAFALLSDGWLEGDMLECPLHGGCFNARTGAAMGDPAEHDLRTYEVRERDGGAEIFVDG